MRDARKILVVTSPGRRFAATILTLLIASLLLAARSAQADAPSDHEREIDAIAGVDVNPTHVNVIEGGVAGSYAVVLSAQPTAPVTITLEADEQITLLTSKLVFGKTSWNIRQVVAASAVDDQVLEEPFHVGMIAHSVSSADQDYDGLDVPDVIVVISDNDANKGYLPLLARNSSPLATMHELDDAPDACPGHAAQVGYTYLDNWDWESDADWYTFAASAGVAYTIQTSDLVSDTDTVLTLYAGDCVTQLAKNDDASPDDLASRIEWQAPDDGVYHILVRSYDWRAHGDDTGYALGIREVGNWANRD